MPAPRPAPKFDENPMVASSVLRLGAGSWTLNAECLAAHLLPRAACGGFFVPEVRVGERVQPQRLLGYLQSPIGGERIYDVRSSEAGIVMTLRANPLVHAQELLVRIAKKEG